MSSEAVKRHILAAIHTLNIPLDLAPSSTKVDEVCSAAKLLRNRVLREIARVEKSIEMLKQRQYGDADESEMDEEAISENVGSSIDTHNLTRYDFMFISEMMVMENLVVPLLLAHGMNFATSLLPQLLKLLAVMLLPIIPCSHEVPRQLDYVRRLIERCGTDDFFWLLIQCIVPVTEKRSKGEARKEDSILLEIVLKMIALFFTGPRESVAQVIGSFGRNHGIELFLVVLNQNYARYEHRNNKDGNDVAVDPISPSAGTSNTERSGVIVLDGDTDEEDAVDLSGESNSGEESSDTGSTNSERFGRVSNHLNVDDQYSARIVEILESDDQLWKWNTHIITAMSAILRCAQSAELAKLIFTSKFRQGSSQQLASLAENSKRFREFTSESKKWRHVARSRNGAVSSNGLLVRGTSSRLQGEGGVIGYTSTLLGYRTKDPIEKVREIDSKKRGRYVKGTSDDASIICNLSLPTKIQLAEQCLSFICYGFEPLSIMVWDRLAKLIASFRDAVCERKEFIAGHKSSGEDVELPSEFEKSVYESMQQVLNYLEMCTSLLRYTREAVRLKKEGIDDEPSQFFNQQWKCISSVITLEHIFSGFELLRVLLMSPDLRRRFGVWTVANYLAELFMTLNHLVDGDILEDPHVIGAAHALVSSVLYKEEYVQLVFDTISKTSTKPISPYRASVLVLLLYSVLRLMEKCSFGGRLLFPRRKKKASKFVVHETEDNVGICLNEADMPIVECDPHVSSEAVKDRPIANGEITDPSTISSLQISSNVISMNGVPESSGGVEELCGGDRSVAGESWVNSTHNGEREVNMRQYFKRLSTGQNVSVLLSSLCHWRANDSDVNEGLEFLIRSFMAEGCVTTLFSASFLITMRDILTNGSETHRGLYEACDEVIYLFFNPPSAKFFDERKEIEFASSSGILQGSESFLGFEVSLRCARSLFCFSSTEYMILEEKGFPDFRDSTVIPLASEGTVVNGSGKESGELGVFSTKKPRDKRESLSRQKGGKRRKFDDENVDVSIDEQADIAVGLEV
ncbi:hypothetical protein, conserved [Trypanosoma brucei gambiense DAL972]|uniref:Timeless N-terminal domain-containing protein n=1 Tax=Trypanosoma brucei gambiense (strain MHOM/CI/86/DAL972) TaxID=679716 RepID=C9ZVU2_TRYB9|nr:hypothetical protein, conserved [Trypanosoma brucei gambiense DAL972]CBH13530.1 hypothetical protein, conserved [Trypanosoma brucei gambiense DAL972]|eukprot:XP_011775807.1 hypothetical protein, conserved [Trypanosoma brucei gambiense DAL972]